MHAVGLNDGQQKEVISLAIEKFVNDATAGEESPFSGNYADYGSQDIRYFLNQMEYFFANAEYRGKTIAREVWSENLVLPSGRSRLRVKTVDDNLVFVNTYQEDNDIKEAEGAAVCVPTDQIGPFIVALLHQAQYGMGRSSPNNLLAILEARLSTTVA
jgi:hypothetical protein